MKMNEIEYTLLKITDILNYSYSLLNDSYRMLITSTNNEYKFINRNKFLRKAQIAFFKLGIIELCKLFGNPSNNHFSFYKLESTFPIINKDTILNINRLEEEEIKNKIILLKEFRNQHFAHTDLDIDYSKAKGKRSVYEINFYFEDAFQLINIAELITDELNKKFIKREGISVLDKRNDADDFISKQMRLLDNRNAR